MNETALRNLITINKGEEKNLFCSVFEAFFPCFSLHGYYDLFSGARDTDL